MLATIPYFSPPKIEIPLPPGLPWEHIPLHGFGMLVALGFLVGASLAMKRATRIGIDPDAINRLVGYLILGTFLGGHIGYGLFYKPDEYFANPIKFLQVWEGLSSVSGLFVCLIIIIWFFKREKLPVWPYVDCLAHGFTVGFFLGRMGCFVAHDHPGTATDFFLGVEGICRDAAGAACHDMGLYEALWSLGMYFVFRYMDRIPRVPGFYALAFFIAYGPVRILMDFVRPESTDVRYMGFTPAQYFVVGFMAVSIALLVRRSKSEDEPVWAPLKQAQK